MKQTKLVEVTIEGSKSYLECFTDAKGHVTYAPYGGGFVINGLPENAIVKEIDALPDNKVIGFCSIDGGDKLKCVCNPKDRWNGWAKPFIFASELPKFLKPFEGDDYYNVSMDGTTIVISNNEYPDEDVDRIELVNGFYNLGLLGFVWDFEPIRTIEFMGGINLFSDLINSTPIDNIEVAPVCYINEDSSELEVCEPDEADLWSVYVHFPENGVECIADCESEEVANHLRDTILKIARAFVK
jgi:hypothetical protein